MADIKTPPMRLIDLEPRWLENGDAEKQGVEFRCPCLRDDCPYGPRVPIMFDNPVRGEPSRWGRHKWHREGDTFDTLTLTPSIHAVDHWHGWLRNGILESC